MLFDPYKGQWWSEPPERIRQAYYMTMRVHYEMTASEALKVTNENFSRYPEFMSFLIACLRRELKIEN